MRDDQTTGSDGGGGGGGPRSAAERKAFADVVLHWAKTVASLRALVDAWDTSIEAMRGTRSTLDRHGRDHQAAAALRTIGHLEDADKLSEDTKTQLRDLLAAINREGNTGP